MDEVFSSAWAPIPDGALDDVMALAYGFTGSYDRLSSERDETLLVSRADGARFTLKIAHPAESRAPLDFQTEALVHLASSAPDLPAPRVVPTVNREHSYVYVQGTAERIVRLLTYLDGQQQAFTTPTAQQGRSLGRALATLDRGLATFVGRPPGGKMLWDVSHALDLIDLVGYVAPERRSSVLRALERFAKHVPAAIDSLRKQIIHNDFNPYNVLVDTARPQDVTGVIDFGDLVYAPLVNDLAIAVSYHIGAGARSEVAVDIIRGYTGEIKLTRQEARLLPTLVLARLAMIVIITEWRASSRPDNRSYILRNHAAAWRGLSRMLELTAGDLRKSFVDHCEA